MSKIDNGGAAFPYEAQVRNEGMTLRDWFAGQVLTAFDVVSSETPPEELEVLSPPTAMSAAVEG